MPTTFIEKLALAFLEYKRRLKDQESSSGWASPYSTEACSCEPKGQPCVASDAAAGADGHTGHDRDATALPGSDFDFDQGSLAAYLKWLRLQHVSTKFGKGLDSAALLLRVEHWLEAGDDKHRHGSNLKPYFAVFLDSQRASSSHTSHQECSSASSISSPCKSFSCHDLVAATPPPRLPRPGTVHDIDEGARNTSVTPAQPEGTFNRSSGPATGAGPGEAVGLSRQHALVQQAPAQVHPMMVTPGCNGSRAPKMSIAEAATPPSSLATPASRGGHNGRLEQLSEEAGAAGAGSGGPAAAPVTPLPLMAGWQQVLEAVAASTYRRSGSGSLRTSRRSMGGSDYRPSRAFSRHRSQQLDDRPTSSAPVTPGISRRASVATNLCAAGNTGTGAGGCPPTLSQHASLPHPPSRLHATAASGSNVSPLLPSHAPFGSRSLPVSAYSCHQLSRLVEENPWSEDLGASSRQPSSRRLNPDDSEEHSLGSEGASLAASHKLSQGSLDGSCNGDARGTEGGYDAAAELGPEHGNVGEDGEDDDHDWGIRWGSDSDCSDSDDYSDSGMEEDMGQHNKPIPEDTLARCDFFAWLDHGEGKDLDLSCMGIPREKLERERVRYLTTEELAHYEVVVDRDNGLLKYQLSGEMLHTFPSAEGAPRQQSGEGRHAGPSVAAVACVASKAAAVGVSTAVQVAAAMGSGQTAAGSGAAGMQIAAVDAANGSLQPREHRQQQQPQQQQEQQQGQGQPDAWRLPVGAATAAAAVAATPEPTAKWIWVCAPSGRLYVAQKVRGQFHHSSFLRGAAVLAAGNLMARHGLLVKLTADSGHYWPKPDHFRWFYEHLRQQGADMTALKGLEFRTKH